MKEKRVLKDQVGSSKDRMSLVQAKIALMELYCVSRVMEEFLRVINIGCRVAKALTLSMEVIAVWLEDFRFYLFNELKKVALCVLLLLLFIMSTFGLFP